MKRFVIVGTQRTGSSALAESIGVHPAVACGWEWSLRVPWRNKIRVAQQALQGDFSLLMDHQRQHMDHVFSSRTEWLGYRSLFRSSDKWLFAPFLNPPLWADRFGGHLAWFRGDPDLHIIHIVRCDNMEWLKSKYLSQAADAYVGKEYPADLKVIVPPGISVKRLQCKAWVDAQLASLEKSNAYLLVRYEEMLANRDKISKAALRFLGLDASVVNLSLARITRQSSSDASSYILNYDELRAALEHAHLLTSPV